MSREIKYRVWDNENKSYNDPYSYAYYALTQDGGLDFYCHGDHMDEADPDVYLVEQYTGLKDKNGKPIYEGDIVKFNETICIVEFDEMYARYTLRDLSDDVVIGFDALIIISFGVIGNIHENPELLEEEE